jgi:hypothetical protein
MKKLHICFIVSSVLAVVALVALICAGFVIDSVFGSGIRASGE